MCYIIVNSNFEILPNRSGIFMKKWMTIFVIIFGLLTLSACGSSNVVKTKAGNISQNDFYNKLQNAQGASVLQQMVYEKVLSDKYSVSKQDVNDQIDQQIQQVEQQNGITSDDQLKAVLAQQGETLKQFRDSMKDNARLQALLFKASTAGIKVTDKDLQNYFDKNKNQFIQVKASHILLKDEATANKVEAQIKHGVDFAKLAEKYSTDTGSKSKGGDLGWFGKGVMLKSFEDTAFAMNVGDISKPVKSTAGWHIIKLTGKKDKLSDFKPAVKQAYLQPKAKDSQTVLNALLKKNNIQVNLKGAQYKGLFDVQDTSGATAPSSSSSSSSSGSNK